MEEVSMMEVFRQWKETILSERSARTPSTPSVTTTTVPLPAISTTPVQQQPVLQIEAATYFSSSLDISNISNDNVSYESTIALLIQALQPCFAPVVAHASTTMISATTTTSTMTNRIYLALSCIVGSLQGCNNNNHHNHSTLLSVSFIQMLATFLYPYIGPIDLEEPQPQPQQYTNNNSDNQTDIVEHNYDIEQIRDLAMEGLIALLQCSRIRADTTNTNTTMLPTGPNISMTTTIDEWIQLLCSMATNGVEYRCTIADDNIHTSNSNRYDPMNTNEDDIYGFHSNAALQEEDHLPPTTTTTTTTLRTTNTIDDGMALLPRKRRSLCFALLQETVYSIAQNCIHIPQQLQRDNTCTTSTITTNQQTPLHDFIQLVTICLHGESDPRCLLQLLQLFDTILTQLSPLLLVTSNSSCSSNTNNNSNGFIINAFFDAVAPYYPIQFQPPPNNDIYGITRISIREAIVRVLSCTLYDAVTESSSNIDVVDDTYTENDYLNPSTSMSRLTCQLLIDCLLPAPNDEPLTATEQMEILEDLQQFLFTKCSYQFKASDPTSTTATNPGNYAQSNLEKLDATHRKSIAEALIVLHEKSSLAVSHQDSSKSTKSKAKQLADLCRSMIATIAITTERIVIKQQHSPWSIMVEEPIRRLSQQLFTSSTNLRIAIAYIACVASSGGHKTLNLCLECGLAKLLNYLQTKTSLNDYNVNNETSITTIYGIGAFFASCRTAIDLSSKDGIQWCPHPLVPYCNGALPLILSYLDISETNQFDNSQQVQIAAIRALESILLVSPMSLIESERVDGLISCLEKLSEKESVESDVATDGFCSAYAETLGTLLGKTLDSMNVPVLLESRATCDQVIIHSEPLRQYFFDRLLPSLLKSVRDVSSRRRDRQLLAKAAAYSFPAASYIVQTLTKSLHEALFTSDDENAESVAVSLAFLFEQENQFAAQAYHELSHPNKTPFDILSLLVPTTFKPMDNMEALFGISTLQLPISNEDRQKNSVALEKAYDIIMQLRRGYEHEMSSLQLQKLVDWVDKVLPPLSDLDTFKLSIALPLLSAAMESYGSARTAIIGVEGKDSRKTIFGMIGDLTEFITASENHPIARLHAARCVHASIARFTPNTVCECPVHNLIMNKLFPALRLSFNTLREKSIQSQKRNTAKAICIDTLNILAMLCSAAACGGGTSSKSSDCIILFLVNLACRKKSEGIFMDMGDDMIDLIAFDASSDRKESTSMSVQVASLIGSILNTECRGNGLWKQRLTHIAVKSILSAHITGSGTNHTDMYESIGTVVALCHVLCSANIRAILSTDQKFIVGTLMSLGLSSSALYMDDPSILKLILVTTLKIICTDLSCFRSIYPLVTGTLRAYASVDESKDGLTCKLLALQALAAVAQMGESDFVVMETVNAVRPAVLSLLGIAADHPIAALRSAAVEVRNTWHVVL